MTSPYRDPRELLDPALKVTPAMLDAFDAAQGLADRHPGTVTARIIDADTLLEPRMPDRQPPRNVVEIFIDPTGILLVATGSERDKPLYWVPIVPPPNSSAIAIRAMRAQLWFHSRRASEVLARQAAPGVAGP